MAFPTIKLEYLVPKNEIFFISWIIDACDELALLETIDAKQGHVAIYTTKFFENYVKDFMSSLKNEGINVVELKNER